MPVVTNRSVDQGADLVDRTITPPPARPSRPPTDGIGAGWLVLLLPVLCCGAPFLIGALAAGGAATMSLATGAPIAVVALALAVWTVRRRRQSACCPPKQPGQHQ